jgi:ankyrin repeat protein
MIERDIIETKGRLITAANERRRELLAQLRDVRETGLCASAPTFAALAAARGKAKALRRLVEIDPGAGSRACEELGGRTPLGMAAAAGEAECVRALLGAGVEDGPDEEGAWALHWAALAGSEACCRILAEAKSSSAKELAPHSWRGETPLMIALRNGRSAAARALLPWSELASRSAEDCGGLTPLMVACGTDACGDHGLFLELLAGSDANATALGIFGGRSSLMIAADSRDLWRAQALLDAGADPAAAEADGFRALSFALQAGYAPMARLLLPVCPISVSMDGCWKGENDLFAATRSGSAECMRLISGHCDKAARETAIGDNLAVIAARENAEALEIALSWHEDGPDGASASDPSIAGEDGKNALGAAVEAGRVDCVEALLRWADRAPGRLERLNPNLKDKTGQTPLMDAAERGLLRCVELLAPISDAKAVDKAGESALILAVKKGNENCARPLLGASDLDRTGGDDAEFTALMHAVARGSVGCARALLEAGASLETRSGRWGKGTALMVAATKGRAECVRLLLAAGADAKAKDSGKLDALIHAVRWGTLECATALIGASDLGSKDNDGDTALSLAVCSKSDEEALPFVEALLAAGADAAEPNDAGFTALMWAARRSPRCLAKLLPVSDPEAKNSDGETAWMVAARAGSVECLRLLENASEAVRWTKNSKGKSALALCAEEEGRAEALAFLLGGVKAGERQEEIAAAIAVMGGDWESLALRAKPLMQKLTPGALPDHGAGLAGQLIKAGRWGLLDELAERMEPERVAGAMAAAFRGFAPKMVGAVERAAFERAAENSENGQKPLKVGVKRL